MIMNIKGKNKTIFDIKDFSELVREYMGDDASRFLDKAIESNQEDGKYQELRFNSDMASYESQVEENRYAFVDILDEIEKIESVLNSPRMNRVKLQKATKEIKKVVNNQI